MDYFQIAFGGFAPHLDEDAAIKFILNALLMDTGFDSLSRLLAETDDVVGVEGDPGWTLERRGPADSNWPPDAQFRAYVDPESFELAYPEFYMSRDSFERYVSTATQAFLQVNPNADSLVKGVLERLSISPKFKE